MNFKDSLQVSAEGERALVIERYFDAPREHVYRAMTDAALLERWMSGPPGWSMSECSSDLRVGGGFRHVWSGPDGAMMAMSGTYRELAPPARVVRTEIFEFGCDTQACEQLGTMELTEVPGKGTRMRVHVLYPSREARDGTLASGMEHGLKGSYAQLDTLLEAQPSRS